MRAAIKDFDDEEESGARPPPKVGERLQIHYEGTGGGWYWGKVLEVEPLKVRAAVRVRVRVRFANSNP